MFDETNVRYYDEFNAGYGSEEEKKKIRKELEAELSEFLTPEEVELAVINETKDIIFNKGIPVRLTEDYTKWGSSDFVENATGIVKDWKFFRFKSYNWYYAYVLVDINGVECPVNIEKLEVLDDAFIEAERNYFRKFKDTYEYDKENNLLKLDDKLQIHCTALVNRILKYLEN